MPDLQPNFKKGDVLTHDVVNQLIAGQARPGFDVRASGLVVREGSNGQVQFAVGQRGGRVCVVASGGIGARSGTTPGTGTVEVWVLPPGSTTMVDSGISVDDVNSFSSTTGGIPSTTWGWISLDDDGNVWFTAYDCGN